MRENAIETRSTVRRAMRAAMLAGCTLLTSCGVTHYDGEHRVTITARLVDADSGAPIRGATVAITATVAGARAGGAFLDPLGIGIATVTTDEEGRVETELVTGLFSGTNSLVYPTYNSTPDPDELTLVIMSDAARGMAVVRLTGDVWHHATDVVTLDTVTVAMAPSTAVEIALDVRPTAVVPADWDGDGDGDLAVLHDTPAGVTVLLNDGLGGFATSVSTSLETRLTDPVVADITGEGNSDLLAVAPATGQVYVLAGTGDGGFDASALDLPAGEPLQVAAGHLDDNERIDVTVRLRDESGTFQIWILHGAGEGQFDEPHELAASTDYHSVHVADLSGDGLDDVVSGSWEDFGDGGIYLFTNRSDGTFIEESLPGPPGPVDYLCDIEGDGDIDVLLNYHGQMLVNYGDGSFGRVAYGLPGDDLLHVADADGDGWQELFVAGQVLHRLEVLGFDGDRFSPVTYILAPVHGVTSAHLDGAGTADIVIFRGDTPGLSVYFNLLD